MEAEGVSTAYQPDPYQGWRVINGPSNTTAHEIMSDTSGSWQLVGIVCGIRQYQRRPQ
jgi:hypothetical protein